MIFKTFKGETLPALGLGTWHLRSDHAVHTIRHALEIGYRHIDTAARYENEAEVGRALKESGLDRGEIFISTKLRYDQLEPARVEERTRESLARLGLDQVDLLMPHWPTTTHSVSDLMCALARVRDKGLTRHLGLSNFPTALVREAIEAIGDTILSNQVEYHPFLSQKPLLAMLRRQGMALTAAIPLARGLVMDSPVILRVAEEHGKLPSQIALRWLIQQDNVIAIPKTGQDQRLKSNFDIFDFALTDDQMAVINGLLGDKRLVNMSYSPQWDPVD